MEEPMETHDMDYAVKKYLDIINAETKHTEVIGGVGSFCQNNMVRFEIRFQWDEFLNTENHPINVSYRFIKLNDMLCRGFFGKFPTYNNTRSTWWVTMPK